MANSFLSRWSQRKLEEQSQRQDEPEEVVASDEELVAPSALASDSEAPETPDMASDNQELAIDNDIDVDSEKGEESELTISQLLANTEVDKAIKKAALRKLFMQPEFNVVDGLNDYDHDYSAVKPLASEVAETLRGWVKDIEENLEQQEEIEGSDVIASNETDVQSDEGEQDALDSMETKSSQVNDDTSDTETS
ncbi:DUF3306 domain-containing protein [Vibrio sp. 10N]|uniref:DUF3306 domain-containing protein n=1 Tax=Vibrio sp. 10N TaxID=3058938 RepID=UPI0028129E8D|nr:DUF3306 domain-containing protein [Vibrio sp. 10N]